ncbi:response regulator transcription factor [Variovorax atrisoli]|uniref:response regulator transcription factor n=1 Tax=Variovorax atrisoli TaxID=3394203 RepID=UPI001F0B76DA|nr:helix-turn-helix transcriptional regulator [Variovorax sp. 369]
MLSAREREVLRLVATGHVTEEIAPQLTISARTANSHVKNIYRKLHAHAGAQAVSYAARRRPTLSRALPWRRRSRPD